MRYLITGANRGIGLEFVRQLIGRGDMVFATARNPEDATDLYHLSQIGQVFPIKLDVTDVDSVARAREAVAEKATGIDVLINNAGAFFARQERLENFDPNAMQRTFETNTIGMMNVTKGFANLLNNGSEPCLVNISSNLGSLAMIGNRRSGDYSYNASKAALNMLTRMLSHDLPDVTVICVHPGWVQTDMGGPSAAITPEESVAGMLGLIGRLTPTDTNSYFNWKGETVAW